MKRIALLRNEILEYEWGSRSAIASLLGEPAPAERPQAELWLGAHPKAPSKVISNGAPESLIDVIRRDPEGVLGTRVADRFRGELPFLLKVLAAEQPLSLQAHPDARRAEQGFARENARDIPLDAPERNYRDSRHKPELLSALTPFSALTGFRRVEEAVDLFGRLSAPGLVEEVRSFRSDPTCRGLARFFEALLTLPSARRERVVADALDRATGPEAGDPAFEWLLRLNERHPGDVGVLSPLLLNVVHLEPGQALFLRPGEPHTYLRGVGIEIMASSDNVLRGALTTKHVDVPELLRILSFAAGDPEILVPRAVDGVERVYDTPTEEFALSVICTREDEPFDSPSGRSVEILICTEGTGRLRADGDGGEVRLTRGSAVLIPAAVGRYRITGCATVYKASVPRAPARPAGAASP